MPSYREMAKALKVSAVGTIQDHIGILIEKGFLKKDGKGIKITDSRTCSMVTVPVVGSISAGTLTDAFEVSMGTVALSLEGQVRDFSKLFALRVQGESMVDAGILAGDIVVVDRGKRTKSGDIVVACDNDQATVKEIRFPKGYSSESVISEKLPNGTQIELIPHNKKFSKIIVKSSENFQVLGPVIAVQRYL
jgi:repressor LexA